jgi:hypothetical protein
MHPVPGDHGLVESQSRFGAVPVHEFVDGMSVAALSIRAGKTVEDSGFGRLQVRQSKDRFGTGELPLVASFLLHDRWPPICHRSVIGGCFVGSVRVARDTDGVAGHQPTSGDLFP